VRLPSIFFALLLLASCGGGESVRTAECDTWFWDGSVGTCLPKGWESIDADALEEEGIPAEVVAAFRSDIDISGRHPAVTVTREFLTEDIPSSEYSQASVDSVKSHPEYTLLDLRDQEVDGDDVELHIFTAQLDEETPVLRFYQLSAVKAKIGYAFTAAVPLTIASEIEDEILLILEHMTFEEPKE